jgi:hypothetical protein
MDAKTVARKLLFNIDAPVHRAWDIGCGDAITVHWFRDDVAKAYAKTFHGKPLADVVAAVKIHDGEWGPVGFDFVRPDAAQRSLATGQTRLEVMAALGLNPLVVEPA